MIETRELSDEMVTRITEEDIKWFEQMPTAGSDLEAFHNPSNELQANFNFSELHDAYTEATKYLNHILGSLPSAPERLLDFGCGWGRMLRMLRRVPALAKTEMHGCDIRDIGLDFIRRTVPNVFLSPTSAFPPSLYRDDAFDLVSAFSVFSHLSPETHLAWAKEFSRIVKPGGLVCATTQGEKFFSLCVSDPSSRVHQPFPVFLEPDTVERFRSGEFMYAINNPNNPHYGHAAVPRSYFEREWGPMGFQVLEWDESPLQPFCLLRRV